MKPGDLGDCAASLPLDVYDLLKHSQRTERVNLSDE